MKHRVIATSIECHYHQFNTSQQSEDSTSSVHSMIGPFSHGKESAYQPSVAPGAGAGDGVNPEAIPTMTESETRVDTASISSKFKVGLREHFWSIQSWSCPIGTRPMSVTVVTAVKIWVLMMLSRAAKLGQRAPVFLTTRDPKALLLCILRSYSQGASKILKYCGLSGTYLLIIHGAGTGVLGTNQPGSSYPRLRIYDRCISAWTPYKTWK